MTLKPRLWLALLFVASFLSLPISKTAADPQQQGGQKSVSGIPEGFESYGDLPSIFDQKAVAHPELGAGWTQIKRAQIEANAMILEMYPGEIGYLARDSEYERASAQLMAKDNPSDQARIHLLNMARTNMKKPFSTSYLEQEGVSQRALEAGKKILLVDTGYNGTISKVIQKKFPARYRSNIQTRLMSSGNPDHPSTRVFLTALNPAAPSIDPAAMHGTILNYEALPRFTHRSSRFAKVDGKLQALSKIGSGSDSEVSKEKAVLYLEDMVYDDQHGVWKELIKTRRAQWQTIRRLTDSGSTEKVAAYFKKLMADHPNDPIYEAMARDYVEMAETGHLGRPFKISLNDIGLAPVEKSGGSNKNALIKKVPQWAAVLQEPQTEIMKLIDANDFGKLGAITDAVRDEEFTRILCFDLGHAPPSEGLKDYIGMLIDQGEPRTLKALAEYTFSQPQAANMTDLFAKLVRKAGPEGPSNCVHDQMQAALSH